MTKIENIEKYVKQALIKNIKTREDDNKLYLEVLRIIDPALVNVNFLIHFEFAREKGLPAYETISRCRRKLQEKYPELKATESVQKARKEHQMDMFEYALKK